MVIIWYDEYDDNPNQTIERNNYFELLIFIQRDYNTILLGKIKSSHFVWHVRHDTESMSLCTHYGMNFFFNFKHYLTTGIILIYYIITYWYYDVSDYYIL